MADSHPTYRLLQGVPTEDCEALLERAEERSYAEGQTVVEEGQDQDGLYMLRDGAVEVLRRGDEPGGLEGEGAAESLTRFSTGNFFGDLSVFDPGPASASVRTIKASQIVYLHRDELLAYLDEHPKAAVAFYRNLLSELATRLRRLDQKLVERILWVQGGERENRGGTPA